MSSSLTRLQRITAAVFVSVFTVFILYSGFTQGTAFDPTTAILLTIIILLGVGPRLIGDYLSNTQQGIYFALYGLFCFGVISVNKIINNGSIGTDFLISLGGCVLLAAGFVGWSRLSDS